MPVPRIPIFMLFNLSVNNKKLLFIFFHFSGNGKRIIVATLFQFAYNIGVIFFVTVLRKLVSRMNLFNFNFKTNNAFEFSAEKFLRHFFNRDWVYRFAFITVY